MTQLAIEIETLGFKDNSVILSLSAIPFKFEDKDSARSLLSAAFNVKFNLKEQVKEFKRVINPDTLAWWKQQDTIAINYNLVQKPDDVDLSDAMLQLKDFIKETGYQFKSSHIFTRTPILSIPIITSLYENINEPCPFNTNMSRDIKTYLDYLTGSNDGYGELKELTFESAHSRIPAHKVAIDILRMQQVYQNLFG